MPIRRAFLPLAAVAAVVMSPVAFAAPQTYQFTIGPITTPADWNPEFTLTGYFTGEDLNADGMLVTDELTMLKVVDNFVYPSSAGSHVLYLAPREFLGGPSGTEVYSALWDFQYTLPTATQAGSLDQLHGWGGRWYKDNFDINWAQRSAGSQENSRGYTWDLSRATASVSPVPEPGTWALMALGLAGLAVGRRRASA